MKAALASCVPALAILAAAVADARTAQGVRKVLATYYPQLPRISIDYAVMEKAENVLVTSGDFGWDDVGTWTAADRHLKTDGRKNAIRGGVTLLDCENSVAVAEGANMPSTLDAIEVFQSATNVIYLPAKAILWHTLSSDRSDNPCTVFRCAEETGSSELRGAGEC